MTTKKIVRIGFLTALGVLLMLIAFPLPFFPEFLTYDFGDVPGIIATFAFGPWAGVLVQLSKCILGYLLGLSKAGIIGMAANFVAGGTMVLVAGLIYQYRKTKLRAIISLAIGSIVASLAMTVANYYIFFPLWGFPTAGIIPMMVTVVFPFNMVKFILSSTLTYLIYKAVKNVLEDRALKPVKSRLSDDRG